MKPFAGFKSEASTNKTGPLPAGPYVAVILAARVDGEEPDQQLVLRMDIAEGEHKDYFRKRFQSESKSGKFEPRYKGDFRIRIPNENNPNAMYPEIDLRKFNDAMYRIETSNPGYQWDWNENGLKGKVVGINMQEAEYNGNTFTRIGRLEIADDVRKGIVAPMKPRGASTGPKNGENEAPVPVAPPDDLPWDSPRPHY